MSLKYWCEVFVILFLEDLNVREFFVEVQNVCLLGVVLPAGVHVVQEESIPSPCVVFVVVVCLRVKWSGAVSCHDLGLVFHEVMLVKVADPLDCSVDFVRGSLPCEPPVALCLFVLELGVEVLQELHAGSGGNVQGRQYEIQALLFLPESFLSPCFALFLDLCQCLESVAGVGGRPDGLVALRAKSHLAVSAFLAGVVCVLIVLAMLKSP